MCVFCKAKMYFIHVILIDIVQCSGHHPVWANPGTARVAQETTRVPQLLLKFKILLRAADHCVS